MKKVSIYMMIMMCMIFIKLCESHAEMSCVPLQYVKLNVKSNPFGKPWKDSMFWVFPKEIRCNTERCFVRCHSAVSVIYIEINLL